MDISVNNDEVVIRPCQTIEDWIHCTGLQSRICNDRGADLIQVDIFSLVVETGGQITGVFIDHRLVGFSLAFVGLKKGVPYLHSSMTVMTPEFQNESVTYELRLAQREDGIKRGFDHMEWTFNPLVPGDAYFNIVRLGGVSRTYLPDLQQWECRSVADSGQSDHLLVEWWWSSSRVQGILAGDSSVAFVGAKRTVIVKDINGLHSQEELRRDLEGHFRNGWRIAGFERKADTEEYILTEA